MGLSALTPSSNGAEAATLLERAYARSRSLRYHGVQLVTVDNRTRRVAVTHVPGHTFLSAQASPVYETDDSTPTSPSADPLSRDPLALLKAHYRLIQVSTATLLGRSATVVDAVTPSGTVAAEFWIDDLSALVVRRESMDSRGNVHSDVKYTELSLDTTTTRTPAGATRLSPSGVPHSAGSWAKLRSQGWWVGADLPGGLSLYDVREATADGNPVLHLTYSDGISTVSVFEQRGRLATAANGAALPGWRTVTLADGRSVAQADGAGLRAAWQARSLVLAIVADVPSTSVPAVIASLPYGPEPAQHRSALGRIHRGLGRIAASINPWG